MIKKRTYYSSKQKAEIALAAIREKSTQAQLTSLYRVKVDKRAKSATVV